MAEWAGPKWGREARTGRLWRGARPALTPVSAHPYSPARSFLRKWRNWQTH